MKILYLDESGDHSLDKVDEAYAKDELTEQVSKFKQDFFGRTDIILHTSDIARNRNGFEKLVDTAVRKEFYTCLNNLIASLDFKVIACVIKKDKHFHKYGIDAIDPYMLSLNILVERFCFDIGDIPDGGQIIAEKRNPTLDNELDLAWLKLKISGTQFLQAVDITRRISQISLRDKKQNIAGLQLADLVVSPIGRFVLKKPVKEDWKVVESKFRTKPNTNNYQGTGLIILPR